MGNRHDNFTVSVCRFDSGQCFPGSLQRVDIAGLRIDEADVDEVFTLSQTAEREFLRFKKVTTDGRPLLMDQGDLYDVLQLDKRADRVLPNGWCMLPPKQVCNRGNAWLSCDKFVTDASHEPDLRRHVWLQGREAESPSLRRILLSVKDVSGTSDAVRGAGVSEAPVKESNSGNEEDPA